MSRYSRQVFFSKIGEEGQQKLLNSTVVIVGCGALGSAQAEQLARAGVGRLRVIDRDVLEESNLQRQCLYDEAQVKAHLPKAVAASQRLQQINHQVTVEYETQDLSAANAETLFQGADLILDGTDNFETRFLINDACIKLDIPWIYGACVSSYGLTMNILPKETPCLRCIFEELPPPGSLQTCDTAGVIGPIVQVIASLQCTEALKLLVGAKDDLREGMLNVDVWEGQFVPVKVTKPRPDCPACQAENWEYLEGQHAQKTTVLCGRNTVQIMPPQRADVDLQALAQQLAPHGKVVHTPFLVRLELEAHVLTIFPDGRAFVEGTKKAAEARALYARYIGA